MKTNNGLPLCVAHNIFNSHFGKIRIKLVRKIKFLRFLEIQNKKSAKSFLLTSHEKQKKTTMIIEPKIKMIRSFWSFWPYEKLWPLCASKKVSPCWYICHTFKYQKWSAINPSVIHSCQLLIEEVFSPIFLNIFSGCEVSCLFEHKQSKR